MASEDSSLAADVRLSPDALVIRPVTAADAAAARALVLAGLAEHWGTLDPALNRDLDDILGSYAAGLFLVAYAGGELVGTGALLPEGPGAARIVRMSVAAGWRRQGVGQQLLQALLAWASPAGYTRIVLETTATWADAVNFYLGNGFRPVAVQDGDMQFSRDL